MRRPLIGALAAVLLVAASCSAEPDRSGASAGDPIRVVASFYPLAEAAERVGGDRVEVVNLTPPGVEPHDLELTPDDVELLATADLVIYLGEGFQPAVEEAVDTIAEGEAVDVLQGLPITEGSVDDHAHGAGDEPEEGDPSAEEAIDPHVWLDPGLMAELVGTIDRSLSEHDPEAAETFAENAATFDAELARLDEEFRAGLDGCDRRLLVTSHAAFGYLAAAYDLDQEAISGLSPEAEPSAQELAEIAAEIEADGVTTVFTESLVSPDLARTLAEEVGASTAVLNPLEGLTQDEVDAGEDYTSVMRANLEVLREGLGCT